MQGVNSHKAQEWLQSPLGEALLQQEARVVEEADMLTALMEEVQEVAAGITAGAGKN